MASSTDIANFALSHIGTAKEISDLDSDTSQEGKVCRRYYETARDEMLRDFSWPFATAFATLSLVDEDPTEEWSFSYRYPSDCLFVRRIVSGDRNDTRQSRIAYRIVQDATGLLIYTDEEDAEIEYTVRLTVTGRFPADFVMALSYRLAAYIAPRIAAGDPFQRGELALKFWRLSVAKAQANALNEEQVDEPPASEFERARG